MSNWLAGLDAVLQWQPMLFLVVGVIAGIVVGAMPGLTATMTVAILLPFTFGMDPVPAMMLLLGIYGAANYSGAIPAILMRLPGTPAAAATILDGHTMHARLAERLEPLGREHHRLLLHRLQQRRPRLVRILSGRCVQRELVLGSNRSELGQVSRRCGNQSQHQRTNDQYDGKPLHPIKPSPAQCN
jgi:hypothetical protein